jgi:D-sedoheptulose 7-phosphate isomerase
MACDLSKTILGRKRHDGAKGFRVIALGDNGPGLTAWANDVGYERVFAEPLRNWVDKGDVVIAITGSGNSPNVVEAVKTAKAQGAKTIALLGFDGGLVKQLVDAYILVESDRYGHIEDVHLALNHLITAYFEVFISD